MVVLTSAGARLPTRYGNINLCIIILIILHQMFDKCKTVGGDEVYFVTFTIVEWIKVEMLNMR